MYSSRIRDETAYDLYARGRALLRDGHPHQAAMLLGKAKLLEPEKASIREALGRALFLSGRWRRARREFAKVVQLNPSDDYAHFALATGVRAHGRDRTSPRSLRSSPWPCARVPGLRGGSLRRLGG